MRLWSIHPMYLDRQGLLACWREGLLAQKVLAAKTRGYKNHPQLLRFRDLKFPLKGIGAYLYHLACEAKTRNYNFDFGKISEAPGRRRQFQTVTRGQLRFETQHLLKKVKIRSPEQFKILKKNKVLKPHPIFKAVSGPIEAWERV